MNRPPDYIEAERWLHALTRAEWATLAVDLMREASGAADDELADEVIEERLETLAAAFGWARVPSVNRTRTPRKKVRR